MWVLTEAAHLSLPSLVSCFIFEGGASDDWSISVDDVKLLEGVERGLS